MLCVDAQVHLWTARTPPSQHRQEPLLEDEYLGMMALAGIDRAVIVPPTWDPTGNAPAIEAARRHPDRFAIMGRRALHQPESRTLIESWKQQPGMLGLRFLFAHPEQEAWLKDGTADWVWPAAERLQLPVMVYMSGNLPLVAEIAERHPGLRLIVDHLGVPVGTRDDAAFVHLPLLLALAKYPNVAVKATGIAGYSTEAYPFRKLHPYLQRVYDAFGPDRIFWGTDLTRMKCTYRQCVTFFTEELPWLTERDKEQIMGLALCRWIGWDLPK
jgi:predicted TIM-barrel fold metal-dependent hydrolase